MNEQTSTRNELLKRVARFSLMAAIVFSLVSEVFAESDPGAATAPDANKPWALANPLKPPTQGSIPVAFLISQGAVIIDFCGPWEVFRDVNIPGRQDSPFLLYTVAETTSPIRAGGGMKIVPDYTIANVPAPKVIVIPAQSEPSARLDEPGFKSGLCQRISVNS